MFFNEMNMLSVIKQIEIICVEDIIKQAKFRNLCDRSDIFGKLRISCDDMGRLI